MLAWDSETYVLIRFWVLRTFESWVSHTPLTPALTSVRRPEDPADLTGQTSVGSLYVWLWTWPGADAQRLVG